MLQSPLDIPDPLGILASCRPVLTGQSHVRINHQAIQALCRTLIDQQVPPPAWDVDTHLHDEGPNGIEHTIGWIFVLDALNFCFWAQGDDPTYRWRIASADTVYDGYMALAIVLRDAARQGVPLWDAEWLATVSHSDVEALFAPVAGSDTIPLLQARVEHLRELGAVMRHYGDQPFTSFVRHHECSAPRIAQAVVDHLPSFNDVATWRAPDGGELEVRFHKRAQILASDLGGALESTGLTIHHREQLTAFADYKVPQVLRQLGILDYAPALAMAIHHRHLIPAASPEEIAIRAATIWGCEYIRQELSRSGVIFTAADVDWLLWNQGQQLPATTEPYHRTVSRFY